MPRKPASTSPDSRAPTPAEIIAGNQAKLVALGTRRTAHLATVLFAGIKYLITNARSDQVRLDSCRLLLSLTPIRSKLDAMALPRDRKTPGESESLAEQDVTEKLAAKVTSALADGSLSTSVLDDLLSRDGKLNGRARHSELG